MSVRAIACMRINWQLVVGICRALAVNNSVCTRAECFLKLGSNHTTQGVHRGVQFMRSLVLQVAAG